MVGLVWLICLVGVGLFCLILCFWFSDLIVILVVVMFLEFLKIVFGDFVRGGEFMIDSGVEVVVGVLFKVFW